MGTVIDFETGVKTDPPCECEDGVGYGLNRIDWKAHDRELAAEEPINSNPFPWFRLILEPNGGFARIQLDQRRFIDMPLTAERAMGICTDAALIATRLLRETK